ncbi:MAG TPA: hypothetical protein VHL32_00895 [Gemmatimonadaceae bacterium]|nr:hypothetical protein [Gemmatimonadaceae bacterium]
MSAEYRSPARLTARLMSLSLALGLFSAAACAPAISTSGVSPTAASNNMSPGEPMPDPRVGLRAGKYDAATASWNMRLLSTNPSQGKFEGVTNSDLAFIGPYAIQGNYNGYQVWDISNPTAVTLKTSYFCPASQSDVSVYKNLLFVSGEGTSGRLDCGAEGVKEPVSKERLRGLRIFDISDINNPKYIGNVQTCRGSHTHTLLVDPKDQDNVYVYISGSAGVRSNEELAGCSKLTPDQDPNSSLFRIEVIKVPLAHPEQAAIVSSPRIFNNLTAPARHGETPEDIAAQQKALADAKARGQYTAVIFGSERPLPARMTDPMLDSIVKARGGTGAPTAADSATLRAALPDIIAKMIGQPTATGNGPRPGPTQCHDITVYPAIGLAGGACEGYGFLLDIRNPANPVRVAAVADSNFSYWHSATFNNDGTKILFSDEWGGGGQPKCRATDPRDWGADAIFTLVDANGTPVMAHDGRTVDPSTERMAFQSYYKLPAPQTPQENCVAHNGSLIPIPGRDVMVQSWYQGGVSVFDWTDPKHPHEIAYFDRGPVDSTRMASAGTWSAYWYNGHIVSSEILRGLDVFELTPSPYISQNELDAARTVHYDYFNTQGQPEIVWPPSVALAGAYADQLERSKGLSAARLSEVRQALAGVSSTQQRNALGALAAQLDTDARTSGDAAKVQLLAKALRDLAASS